MLDRGPKAARLNLRGSHGVAAAAFTLGLAADGAPPAPSRRAAGGCLLRDQHALLRTDAPARGTAQRGRGRCACWACTTRRRWAPRRLACWRLPPTAFAGPARGPRASSCTARPASGRADDRSASPASRRRARRPTARPLPEPASRFHGWDDLGVTAYLSALAVCAASIAAGAALCCRPREWSWTAPPVGLAALMLLALVTVRLPGHGTTAAIAVGLATIAAVVVLVRRRVALVPLAAGLPGRRRRPRGLLAAFHRQRPDRRARGVDQQRPRLPYGPGRGARLGRLGRASSRLRGTPTVRTRSRPCWTWGSASAPRRPSRASCSPRRS